MVEKPENTRKTEIKTAPGIRRAIQGLNGPRKPGILSCEIAIRNRDILKSIIVQPIRVLRRNHLRLETGKSETVFPAE